MFSLLLTCGVSALSAQTFSSPFGSGLSLSYNTSQYERQGDVNNSRYSGLTGGKTTVDAGYKLFDGVPKSLVESPLWEKEAEEYKDSHPMKAGGMGGFNPGEEDRLPIGDAILPMLVFALAYAVWKRRRTVGNDVESD